MPDLAYIADGRLHFLKEGAAAVELESKFAEQVRARASRMQEKDAWKKQGSGAKFMMGLGGAPNADELLAGQAAPVLVRMTGLSRGRAPGEILYSLHTGAVDALFALGLADSEEKRLFHQTTPVVTEPAARAAGGWIACAVRGKAGFTHIGVMRDDGTDLIEATEGDAVDGWPSWVPGGGKQLVYQSQGIARDAAGHVAGLGPSAILKLDAERGTIDRLLESEGHDFLAPHIDASGALWCIRRPCARPTPFSALRAVGDLLLFPFRLLRAIAGWVNFFSVRYTGKPMITSGSARQRQADMRKVLLAGNMLNAARDAGAAEDEWRVDSSWQLVRLAAGATGEPEVMAKNVFCFDVGEDGSVVYSDGRDVHQRGPDGTVGRLATARRIERVVIVR